MNLILPAISAFFISLLAIFPTIWLAKRFRLVDSSRIVPRAGGLPVFLGIMVAILLFTPFEKTTAGILLGSIILLIVGLLDDKYQNLSPYFRLSTQFLAAAAVVISGIGIQFITNPLGGIIHFDSVFLLAQVLAIFWIVWVMNMINWSKGVDGQMPGTICVATIILGLLALKLNLLGDPSQLTVAKLAFITAGSSFALLIVNWHPAKIFPGFSGSTILGFMVAVLAILSGGKVATAGLVLLIPATDFIYTFFRRILQGKSPVWGDKGHLHHKLLQAGLTHPQIALFYILGSAILGAIALSLSSQGKLFASLLVGAIILGGILWLNFFGQLSKKQDPNSG